MLQLIDIGKLDPHPDNPRKDLGDLTELAESIKTNGILQNLTVVPWFSTITRAPADDGKMDGHYVVVIGHRRLAAAKLAGLQYVPCIILDMSPADQVATMLLENMQRSDLTVYEQAQGFQMLLDFGESMNDIADRTGFSQTTVRRRVKLLELDQEKFKKSIERGGTLMDYAELEKIKNINLRNSVLEKIGTPNFKWELQRAIDEEEQPKRKEALVKELDEFAKPCKNGNGKEYVVVFYGYRKNNWKKPADTDTADYYYSVENHQNVIYLYKKVAGTNTKKENDPKEESFKVREAQLKQLTQRAYESRYEFVKNFSAAKKYREEIMTFVIKKLLAYGRAETEDLFKILNIDIPDIADVKDHNEKHYLESELILKKYTSTPEYIMLVAAYLGFNDRKDNKYYYAQSWAFKIVYEENRGLNTIYDNLISLGYQISDEERAMMDGTHELFQKEEVEQ